MNAEEIAKAGLILKCTVGSELHGINLPGADDHDEMGVCIEPEEYVIGLRNFEQWVYRAQPVGVKSQPGDVEGTIYSLRKFASLALKGNPTILALLFAPAQMVMKLTWEGAQLQARAGWFASRLAGAAFLGYMQAQRMRLEGIRGQMRVKRTELIEKFGFDTKYAGHVVRLGYQGIEFMQRGRITLPMPEEERRQVVSIREGAMGYDEVLTLAGEIEKKLKDAIDTSPLPEKPMYDEVNQWLVEVYLEHWKERRPYGTKREI